MKNNQSELTTILLNKLEELVSGQERQHKEQQQFFRQQQQQWEQKVSTLTTEVQGLQEQLQIFSKSLLPLTEQLKSLATLSDSLRNS